MAEQNETPNPNPPSAPEPEQTSTSVEVRKFTIKQVRELHPLADVYELNPECSYFVHLPILRPGQKNEYDGAGQAVTQLLASMGITAVAILAPKSTKGAIKFFGLFESEGTLRVEHTPEAVPATPEPGESNG
jgi:hypothetical protein